MNEVIKVALIGCGRVAGHHARSIASISEMAKVLAVCGGRAVDSNSSVSSFLWDAHYIKRGIWDCSIYLYTILIFRLN